MTDGTAEHAPPGRHLPPARAGGSAPPAEAAEPPDSADVGEEADPPEDAERRETGAAAPRRRGAIAAPLATWAATRTVLLLCVFKVLTVPGADVTQDVSGIYRVWFQALRDGTFPLHDVTWQYPPAAALPLLSPGALPFLDYASAFFVLVCATDAAVLGLLLYAGGRPGRRRAGAWVWIAGVALLGPTAYARYDLMVTAVAVAALLAASRHPRAAGVLAGFGATLKAWPLLMVLGVRNGRATRRSWGAALLTGLLITASFALTMPGALEFLTAQRDRGTEVESLGSLVFHVIRHLGWPGQMLFHYGSVEFMGPYVPLVSDVALGLSACSVAWLAYWRWRMRRRGVRWTAATAPDAAFTAVLLLTTTSRVISPQYMVWLVGAAAVCLTLRSTGQLLPAWLVVAASAATLLEFPLGFGHVVASDTYGVTVLAVRNGLLVAACLVSALRLWRSTLGRRGGRTDERDADAAEDGAEDRSDDRGGGREAEAGEPEGLSGRVSPPRGAPRRATQR